MVEEQHQIFSLVHVVSKRTLVAWDLQQQWQCLKCNVVMGSQATVVIFEMVIVCVSLLLFLLSILEVSLDDYISLCYFLLYFLGRRMADCTFVILTNLITNFKQG